MSTYNNNEDLIVYKFLRRYLDGIIKEDEVIKEDKKSEQFIILNKARKETIIEILNYLEEK
tara:strand:+ start:741 stop:923 length:183 start_codon:yes stop_codon:yes gene_type:complete